MKTLARLVLLLGFGLLAVLPTAALVWDWALTRRKSDAELISSFNGAAFEDVFGFGFWFTWAILALLELLALWRLSLVGRRSGVRYLLIPFILLFVVASVGDYFAYAHTQDLWDTHVDL